jgi:hypothetical protein
MKPKSGTADSDPLLQAAVVVCKPVRPTWPLRPISRLLAGA